MIKNMSSLQQIEEAVQRLSTQERAAFRTWFVAFDAGEWDRQFEEDVATGRLDCLAEEARADNREGRCTDR